MMYCEPGSENKVQFILGRLVPVLVETQRQKTLVIYRPATDLHYFSGRFDVDPAIPVEKYFCILGPEVLGFQR